jgi:hypothetical protein
MKLYEPETWHADWRLGVKHAFVAWIVTVKLEKCGNVIGRTILRWNRVGE